MSRRTWNLTVNLFLYGSLAISSETESGPMKTYVHIFGEVSSRKFHSSPKGETVRELMSILLDLWALNLSS